MIIRNPNRNRYVNISKVPLEDRRLSWKARGLHAFLMSKPDNWDVIVEYLVGQSEKDGRDSVRGALKELEDAGYIARTKTKNSQGKYDGTDCEIFEEPHVYPDETGDGFSNDGKPGPGIPEDGKSNTNDYLDIESNEERSTVSSAKKDYTPEFLEWWKIYLKPVDKKKTFGCWNATLRERGGTVESLMLATSVFADEMLKEGREKQFIMNSTTFLGPGERWREYLPAVIDQETLNQARCWDLYDQYLAGGDGVTTYSYPEPSFPRPQNSEGNLLDGEGRAYYRDPMQPTKRRYFDDE